MTLEGIVARLGHDMAKRHNNLGYRPTTLTTSGWKAATCALSWRRRCPTRCAARPDLSRPGAARRPGARARTVAYRPGRR